MVPGKPGDEAETVAAIATHAVTKVNDATLEAAAFLVVCLCLVLPILLSFGVFYCSKQGVEKALWVIFLGSCHSFCLVPWE